MGLAFFKSLPMLKDWLKFGIQSCKIKRKWFKCALFLQIFANLRQYFKSKNSTIKTNVNHTNNCCLYSCKSNESACIKLLKTTHYVHFSMLFFPSIYTHKSLNTLLYSGFINLIFANRNFYFCHDILMNWSECFIDAWIINKQFSTRMKNFTHLFMILCYRLILTLIGLFNSPKKSNFKLFW